MKRSDAFPSTYLSKDDVAIPIILTIAEVQHVTLKGDNGDEQKVAAYFVEPDSKPFILNNTNWMVLEDAFGEDSDLWKGKSIELFKDPSVMFGGKRVGGVRVRLSFPAKTNPAFSNFAGACDYALEQGVTVEGLKAYLKLQGLTTFSPSRDSDLVYRFVEDMIAVKNAEPL